MMLRGIGAFQLPVTCSRSRIIWRIIIKQQWEVSGVIACSDVISRSLGGIRPCQS